MGPAPDLTLKTKIRLGRVYLGHENPGWPQSKVDLPAEVRRYGQEMARLAGLKDVEFVEGGLVSTAEQARQAPRRSSRAFPGFWCCIWRSGTGGLMQTLMDSSCRW